MLLAGLVLTGSAAPSSSPPAADEATAYQMDATHDGSIADAGLSAPLTQAWSVALPHTLSYPLVAEGMVFVESGNTLYALNQATGSTIWSHPTGRSGPGIAYDRGQVFVVNGSGLLSAFDAVTGALAWSQDLPGQWSFSSPPTASNGIVYTGGAGSGGTLYAVRESDGNLLWTGSVANGDASSPAVTANGVYVDYACQQDYDFDPLAGTLIWHHTSYCEGGGGTTPVVANGHVLDRDSIGNVSLSAATGAEEGPFGVNGLSYYAYSIPAVANGVAFMVTAQSPNATLSAVAGSGLGSTNWTFNGDGKISTPPVVAGGSVFIGSATDNIYALDATTGATTWSTNLGSVPSTLAASNGTLVATSGSTLTAYSAAGPITDPPANQSLPTVEGSVDLNENEAADVGIWSGLPSAYTYQWELCDAAGANCADIDGATSHSYVPGADAYGGTLRVRVVATNDVGSSTPVESAPSAVLGLATAVPAFSTSPVVSGTATVGQQLSTTNGTWTHSATSYAYQWQRCDDTGANCVDIPAATSSQYTLVEDDVGYEIRAEVLASNAVGPATDYAPSPTTDLVADLDAPAIPTSAADQATTLQTDATHDGAIADAGLAPPLSQAWSVTLPSSVSYAVIVNGTVFVTAGNTLYALNQATGATIWSDPIAGGGGPAYDRGQVFVADSSNAVTAVDAATGSTAWSGAPGGGAPSATNGIVYFGLTGSVFAVQESDGKVLWSQSVDGDNSSPAVTAHGLYVSYACQQDYAFEPILGTLLWHHDSPCGGGGGSTAVEADGHVYAPDWAIGNVILSAASGVAQGSFDTPGLSTYSTPAIAGGQAFTLSGDSTLSATAGSGLGLANWTFNGDGNLDTAPIVAGGLVYVGSSGGNLYALDTATGATSWSTNVGTPLTGSLAGANGTLVVSTGSQVLAYRTAGDITNAPSNQTLPTIAGPADLSGLEAADVGIWSGLPSAYAYQWELCDSAGANCADIAGATGASFLPPAEDIGVGATLRVRIVATNGVGSSDPVASAPSAYSPLVVVAPPPSSGAAQRPVVSAAAAVGQQLRTTNGIWTNDPTGYAYKWQRCSSVGLHCADISGATSSKYSVASADLGHEIRSEVRARNAVGPASIYAPSTPTKPVSAAATPQFSHSPVVSGKAVVGSQLLTTNGAWMNAPTGYQYRWQRCNSSGLSCVNIASATHSYFILVAADLGHKIRSEVLARNAAGPAATGYAPSALTSVVVSKPAVITLPRLSGVAKVGKSLSVTKGTWNYSPTGYAYQWLRCTSTGTSCKAITGATRSSYRLTSADAGHKLEARVTASNPAGSATATSNKSGVISK
jgi:outer membrane protein assembly factor BamB